LSRHFNLSVVTILTSVIIGMLLVQWGDAWALAGERVGIGLAEADGGVEITGVTEGEPADRAGVRAGDLLVAVDGHPVDDFESLAATDPLWRRGVPLVFTIVREGRAIERTVIPGASFPWATLAAAAVPCLAYLAIGLLAFGQSPNDTRIRLLFGFSVAVALEFALPADLSLAPWWSSVHFVIFDLLTGLQVALLLHLASVIPRPAPWLARGRWFPFGYYAIGFTIGAVTALSTILTALEVDAPPFLDGIGLVFINSWVLPLWSVAVAGILTHQMLRAATPRSRRQATLIFLGILPWMAYQVLYQLVVPAGDNPPPWMETLQPAVLLVFPAAVFIAIFKFHLLDIELVLRRSVVFVLVTASLVALFATAFGLGNLVFGSMEEASGVSAAAMSLGMLVLGLLFAPVRRVIQKTVDRRLFPERHEMARLLTDLAAELPTLGSLPAMGRRLVGETVRVFAVETATLLVADPDTGVLVSLASSASDPNLQLDRALLIEPDDPGLEYLRRAGRALPADQLCGVSRTIARRLQAVNVDLVVGLRSGSTLAGVLMLGPKSGGEPFHSSELQMLDLFSHAAATVFENARLFESATYESLTGLMRRETIIEALDTELQRSLRYHRPLSVGMVDIDRFKRVNDSLGHLAGDALLQRVAHALRDSLRATDSIGRYGGEEFLFFLPETEMNEAWVVAEKLRSAVEQLTNLHDDAPDLRVTVSVGVATVDHDQPESPTTTQLILEADCGLLEAKRTGRNRVIAGSAGFRPRIDLNPAS